MISFAVDSIDILAILFFLVVVFDLVLSHKIRTMQTTPKKYRKALGKIIDLFEYEFVENGEIVNDPPCMLADMYGIAKHAYQADTYYAKGKEKK